MFRPRPLSKAAGKAGGDQPWRHLAQELEEVALEAHWQEFLTQNPAPRESVLAALRRHITDHSESVPEGLSRKVEEFAMAQAAERRYVIHTKKGAMTGGKFYKKGTDLPEDIYLSNKGTPFRLPAKIGTRERLAILDETGVSYRGKPVLGHGAMGQVRVAETLSPEGVPKRIVAAKEAGGAAPIDGMGTEVKISNLLPPAKQERDGRETYAGKKKNIALQNLALGGDGAQFIDKLTTSSRLSTDQKREVFRWWLKKCMEELRDLHQGNPKIWHRDLRLDQFLFAPQADGAARVTLTDFGRSSTSDSLWSGLHLRRDRRDFAKMFDHQGSSIKATLGESWGRIMDAVRNKDVSWDTIIQEHFDDVISDDGATELLDTLKLK